MMGISGLHTSDNYFYALAAHVIHVLRLSAKTNSLTSDSSALQTRHNPVPGTLHIIQELHPLAGCSAFNDLMIQVRYA